MKLIESALFILCQLHLTRSTTFYVDPSISTPGSCTSWPQACNTLDSALAAARSSFDSIWLKGGYTYTPTNPQDRTDCFVTRNGITISGGFAGTESNINQRPTLNSLPSIISGDIGVSDDDSDNCYHVIQYTLSLTLDNVVIEHGNANYNLFDYSTQTNTLHRYGGALITSNVGRTTYLYLSNVIIRNNSALNGGALWIASSPGNNVDVIIKDSTFEYNRAVDGVYEGGYGGAIYNMFLANLTLFNTQFVYNQAAFRGGAIYQDYGGLLHADGCAFRGNRVNGFGGAIFSEDRNSQTAGTFPKILASTFRSNYAGVDGGAIYWYNGVIGTLTNNQFMSNLAENKGGGVALINSQSTSTGNTYTGNTATSNSSTNDEFVQADFQYDSIDGTLTFDLNVELSELYTKWSNIQTEADLHPFDAQDSLCYVDGAKSNSVLDGTSWATAFNGIQDCLDELSVSGGELWVKSGTYIPTIVPQWKLDAGKPNTNIHRSFVMYGNIRMYGGFAGTETSRTQRNWRDNPTYLSCQQNDRVQCNQIVNSADDTLIDGFIFINAGTGVSSNRRRLANSLTVNQVLSSTSAGPGSGVWSNSTTISIVNCIFHKLLSTGKGGAMYCIGLQGETGITKSPTLINVAFLGNRAGARGGAIAADVGCHFVCKWCKFDSNSCSKKGGAIYLDFDSDPTLVDAVFTNNYALESGGCIAEDGRSVTTFNGSANFTSNYAVMEGGCLYSGSGVANNIDQGFSFEEPATFRNNSMFHADIGQSDMYGWPFSVFQFSGTPTTSTTSQPTVTSTPGPTSPVRHSQPNVLLFMVDDMSFTAEWNFSAPLGTELAGNKEIVYNDFVSPNIASFMQEAVIFPNSYSAGPKCTPSRFSTLTGRQPTRSEWGTERTLITTSGYFGVNVTVQATKLFYNDSIWNIPYVLQNDANTSYYTGTVGKWHLLQNNDNSCADLENTINSTLYADCINLVKQQGFDFVGAWYYGNIKNNPYFSHNPEWMVSQSQKFIAEAQTANKPFFLYFATTLMHDPNIAVALNNYTRRDSPKGTLRADENPTDTLMSARSTIWTRALSTETDSTRLKKYAGHCWIDDTFGALLNYLKNNDLYDNTFIVLMNDHGMGAKGTMYQQGSRIITFVRYPPLFGDNGPYYMPQDFVVSNVDLAAVIFEVTGIAPPDEYKLDGISWVSDVQNAINNPPTSVAQTCCHYKYIDIYNSHSIVDRRYQYIFRGNPNFVETDDGVDELYVNTYDQEQFYDLVMDPNQRINQIANVSYLTEIAIFRALMRDYLQDTCPIDVCVLPPSDAVVSGSPTLSPITVPTLTPTETLTSGPTTPPTMNPSQAPTPSPTRRPAESGETWDPSVSLTNIPSISPTDSASLPSASPTLVPTATPTAIPSISPTMHPASNRIVSPTSMPTVTPSGSPTKAPTDTPSLIPSFSLTETPTENPSFSRNSGQAKLSWTDPSEFGAIQFVCFAAASIGICLCCVGCTIGIKRHRERKYIQELAASHRKSSATEIEMNAPTAHPQHSDPHSAAHGKHPASGTVDIKTPILLDAGAATDYAITRC